MESFKKQDREAFTISIKIHDTPISILEVCTTIVNVKTSQYFSQNASICHVVFLKKKSYDGCSFVQWSPLFLNYSKTASGITLPWEWSKIYFEKWFGVLPKSNRFIIWKNSGNSKKNTAFPHFSISLSALNNYHPNPYKMPDVFQDMV